MAASSTASTPIQRVFNSIATVEDGASEPTVQLPAFLALLRSAPDLVSMDGMVGHSVAAQLYARHTSSSSSSSTTGGGLTLPAFVAALKEAGAKKYPDTDTELAYARLLSDHVLKSSSGTSTSTGAGAGAGAPSAAPMMMRQSSAPASATPAAEAVKPRLSAPAVKLGKPLSSGFDPNFVPEAGTGEGEGEEVDPIATICCGWQMDVLLITIVWCMYAVLVSYLAQYAGQGLLPSPETFVQLPGAAVRLLLEAPASAYALTQQPLLTSPAAGSKLGAREAQQLMAAAHVLVVVCTLLFVLVRRCCSGRRRHAKSA